MKGLILGTAVAAISFGYSTIAFADADALMARCAEIEQNEGEEGLVQICACVVEQAGDNEALLEELTELAKIDGPARSETFEADASEEAKAALNACKPDKGEAAPTE